MKKKHPFLYNIIRRSIVVVLLAMMALTAYNQSTGSLISPEGLLAKIITPFRGLYRRLVRQSPIICTA